VLVYNFPNQWAYQRCLTFYSAWCIVRFPALDILTEIGVLKCGLQLCVRMEELVSVL
jgi:hypothetical protein